MRLLVTVTPHGFGHAAQTAVVINALRQRLSGLTLSVHTTVPRRFLEERIRGPFEYVARATDFGLRMTSALQIDLEASAQDYLKLHRDWQRQVEGEAAAIRAWQPDLVLSNVAYLPLAAAQRLGVPGIALCSLNWAGIYRHYFARRPEAAAILEQMETAYNSAEAFLVPQPSMAMPELVNPVPIGCLARLGQQRRAQLRRRLGASRDERLVLVSLGGTQSAVPLQPWPALDGIRWIVPAAWKLERPDICSFESLGWSFTDVLRSSDGLLGKCGYGTVCECACNGTPLFYFPRPDWPEERVLLDWLQNHGRCQLLPRDPRRTEDIRAALERCWARPAPARPQAAGASEAAELVARLGGGQALCGMSGCTQKWQ